jgi:hypothetical protein
MMFYALALRMPYLIIGVAFIIIVCRANRADLPAIVRAIMRVEPHGDDSRKDPPSLPRP